MPDFLTEVTHTAKVLKGTVVDHLLFVMINTMALACFEAKVSGYSDKPGVKR